jgi:hypothetical protein
VTEITLKNDPEQKPPIIMSGAGNFATQIPFRRSQLKNFIYKLATFALVRPILSPLV